MVCEKMIKRCKHKEKCQCRLCLGLVGFQKENKLWKNRNHGKGNSWNLGLTKETDERVNKNSHSISLASKGKSKSRIHRKNISRGRKNMKMILGYINSPDTRDKMRVSHKNKKLSKKHKINIGLGNKGKVRSEKTKENMKGHTGIYIRSEKCKKNMRIAAIKYIKNNSKFVSPRLGRYEKQILDELQNILGFSIKRQFYINGYFLDGYCQELNLAIEVDEEHHYQDNVLSKKDVDKQNNIINLLNCNFIRIEVKDIIENKKININIFNNYMKNKLGGI